jgi:hypothetical protein
LKGVLSQEAEDMSLVFGLIMEVKD